MPRPKAPKKNNGAEAPVIATDATKPTADSTIVEKAAAAATAPEGRNTDMKTTATKKARMPEIVKSESRSNLVPINLEDEIRRHAYLLAERRGFQPGHEAEDWQNAEREVQDRYHQHSAQHTA